MDQFVITFIFIGRVTNTRRIRSQHESQIGNGGQVEELFRLALFSLFALVQAEFCP